VCGCDICCRYCSRCYTRNISALFARAVIALDVYLFPASGATRLCRPTLPEPRCTSAQCTFFAAVFFLRSLDLLRWNGIISLRRRKSKANDFRFSLWPVSWLGCRRNRFCVSPAANYCANVTHKVHFIGVSDAFCLEISRRNVQLQVLGGKLYSCFLA
jgi:hypothetical protein